MRGPSAKDVVAALTTRIGELARELLGEPNRELSTPGQLRFGRQGSVAVEIDGENAGRWYDHEHGIGGAAIELIRQRRGLSNRAALDWARQWLGLPAFAPSRRPASAADAVAHPEQPMPLEDLAAAEPPPDLAPPHDSADPSPSLDAGIDDPWQAKPRARSAKKAAEDAKRAARVVEIVTGCEDPTGTRVETYLHRRGITTSPMPTTTMVRWLPSRRMRPARCTGCSRSTSARMAARRR